MHVRRTITLIAVAVVMLIGAPSAAQAYSWPNDVPDLPDCAATIANQRPTNWPDLEGRCDVTASGDDRLFINMLELFVDELGRGVRQLEATVTTQQRTVAAQQAKIAHQAKVIKRLRHRLAAR